MASTADEMENFSVRPSCTGLDRIDREVYGRYLDFERL